MLSQARIVLQGNSAYAHEQEAIAFLRSVLPDADPYQVWELVEFVDPSSGRLHEVDAIVIGYSAVYVIEIKSGPGVYEGDTVDWYRTPPGESARFMEPPLKLVNFKAKVLKSLVQSKLRDAVPCPFFQPLVFLSHANVELRFRNYGDQCVVTRKTLLDALKLNKFPGVDRERPRINNPQMRALAKALEDIGVRASKGVARVGSYELGGILEEGSGYQDRSAKHAQTPGFRRRARIYLVPQQTSVERRQQLRRAADREARLLEEVKEHPGILSLREYVPDAPLGPTVLFDEFDGVRLDVFLRSAPEPSFSERIELIEKIGRALHHCHGKKVVHGGLSPFAVLVQRREQGLAIKLYNFQFGSGEDVTPTMHWSSLKDEPWALFQAPELRENPLSRTPTSDMFSLGALAYLILTGKPPAESILELDTRLRREHELDPRVAADGILEGVANAVAFATASKPVNRADDVHEWLELLLGAATAPEPVETPEVNPLTARAGDVLGDDLLVKGVLGQGASSRVLEVEKDGRSYALKVALTAEDDDRLKDEVVTLNGLRHARIVQFVEQRELGGRTAILMAKAGEQTLQRQLAKEGAVSLDYASRYGEDLLLALEELEERQLLHRDIKPANLGVGAVGKRANHLTLFDFSLALDLHSEEKARVGRTQLSVGTAVYRDPFLRLRGAWDAAADRWSAAITLHEVLTGVRPSFSVDGSAALEPEAEVVLAAERFDASAREHLVRFFGKALHRDAATRFASAEDMRHGWNACFGSGAVVSPSGSEPTPSPSEEEPEELTDTAIAAISPDTPIESLPLSVRAKNALDRAGLTTARDLLELPDNRLSAVRGVGRLVAKQILELRDRWRALRSISEAPGKPFFAGYRGDDISVTSSSLPSPSATTLRDAGLQTLAALAAAPSRHIEALAKKASLNLDELRKVLEDENARSNVRQRPTTLEGWLDALLPAKRARSAKNLRVLFGLAEPFLGQIDPPVAEVARALGMTRANLYLQLGREREHWVQHGAVPELQRLVHTLVADAGGALPADRAAQTLRELIPSDGSSSQPLALAAAAALLRIVTLVEREAEGGLVWERRDGKPWLLADSALTSSLDRLGAGADELAARAVLASPGEATRVLSALVEGTPFANLSPERLTELAALASRSAARSARLELYPRKLDAGRALLLSNSVLVGELTPEVIQQRVQARYPEAQPLPSRPELDALLTPLQIKWDDAIGRYVRPGERRQNTEHTSLATLGSIPTLTSSQRALDPSAIAHEDFEERLRITRDRKTLKVLGVVANDAQAAALALTKLLGVRRVSLDEVLSAAIHEVMREQEVSEEVFYGADHVGPGGDDWPELRQVAEQAAERVASRLFPAREPLLLVQPGLLARYRLNGFLRRLLEASRDTRCAALFLLVPSRDRAGVPKINETLVIPEVGLPQTLWVPHSWLRAREDAA
ncbi:MAG TPA: BREX system serine/threonine kinase PglW [Lacunisphaera sp.]|nr:BREX system serine/threonine kinase PglW [Lacunisphaera sp.]